MARRDVNGKSARCGRARAAAAPAPCSLRARRPRPHRALIARARRSQARRRRPRPLLHRSFSSLGEKRPGASRRARPGLRRAHSSSARSRRAHPVRGPRAPGAPGRRERGARALRTTAPFPLETAAWKMIGAPPSRPRAPLVTRAPAAPAPCLGFTRGGRARAHIFERRGYSGGPVGVDGGERARPGCQFLSCTPSGLFSELARCFVSLSMSVSSARIHTHGAHKGAGRADVVGDGRKQKCRIPEGAAVEPSAQRRTTRRSRRACGRPHLQATLRFASRLQGILRRRRQRTAAAGAREIGVRAVTTHSRV